MYKLTDSASFFKDGEYQVTLLNLTSPQEDLEKSAADIQIQDFVSTISPRPGKSYLHINAMGAGEYYGANRNGDYFPEDNLKQYYKTFETSPAHFFRHHINKDPSIAQGVVIFSIYNERMHRVELVVECDVDAIADIERKIAVNEFPKTSMACKTPYDVCSICGNKASSRQTYCTHLTNELGRVYADGRKVMAINSGPLRFFDISYVTVPADPTSSILNKVANEADTYISSAEEAELADLAGLEKTAEFKKVSELIKQIEGDVVASSPVLNSILSKIEDLPIDLARELAHFNAMEVLATLAKRGISPSVKFLAEMIGLKLLGEDAQGIGELVEKAMSLHGDEEVAIPPVEVGPVNPSPFLERHLDDFVQRTSLLPEYVEKRASGVGYFGNGPVAEPIMRMDYRKGSSEDRGHSMLSEVLNSNLALLLTIGGAALLYKHMLAKEMETQAKNSAKIKLVKQASDYMLASALSRSTIKPYSGGTLQDEAKNDFTANRLASKLAGKVLKTKSEAAANALKIGNLIFGNN